MPRVLFLFNDTLPDSINRFHDLIKTKRKRFPFFHQHLPFNHIRVLNECNDPYSTGTLWAYEGIGLVILLYKSRPISSESLVGQLRCKDA